MLSMAIIRTTTRTCLEVAHIRPVVAGSCVTLGVKLDLKHKLFSDKLTFGFDHLSYRYLKSTRKELCTHFLEKYIR